MQQGERESRQEALLVNELARNETVREVLRVELERAAIDLHHMAQKAELVLPDQWGNLSQLAEDFKDICESRNRYDQVGCYDRQGRQLVRVERATTGELFASFDEATVTPSWLSKAKNLRRGQFFMTPVTLVRQGGSVVWPRQPVQDIVLPLFSGRKQIGYLAVRYCASRLTSDLDRWKGNRLGDILLCTADGSWLKGPTADEDWSEPGGSGGMPGRFPLAWRKLATQEEGAFLGPEGLLTVSTLLPRQELISHFSELHQGEVDLPATTETAPLTWKIVLRLPPHLLDAALAGEERSFRLLVLIVLPLLAAGALVVSLASQQRQQSMDSLTAAHAELEQIFNTSSDGLVVLDQEQRLLRVSENLLQHLGVSPAEALGKKCYELLHSSACHTDLCPVQRVLNGEERIEMVEEKHFAQGSHIFSVITTPLRDGDGTVMGAVQSFNDITELQRAHEVVVRVREAEHRFIVDITNGTPVPTFVIGGDQRVIVWNRAMEVLTGVEATRVIGTKSHGEIIYGHAETTLADLLLNNDQEGIQQRFRTSYGVATRMGGARIETWFPNFVGKFRYVIVEATPVLGESGEVVAVIETLQDITDRKQLEEELWEAKEAAEVASCAKSEFLANMSHELRTPMNGVIGMTELVLASELNSEQRDYLELARQSADSLLALLNSILDFSKLEAHMLEVEKIPFDLCHTLEPTLRTMALQAERKGVELYVHSSLETPSSFVGDPGRLRQIIVNLVGNALKFTDKGEVSIAVSSEPVHDRSVLLHFNIADTGIGIPADKLDSIFSSFTQADSSMTRRYGGTGLGLAISRQLAQLMKGNVQVVSSSEAGTTFRVTVELGIGEEKRGEAPQFLGKRALIYLPKGTGRAIARELLTEVGVEVACLSTSVASDQEKELGLFKPDLILVDGALLPSVLELCRDSAAAVVLLSGVNSRQEKVREKSWHLLNKPLLRQELWGILAKIFTVERANFQGAAEDDTPHTPSIKVLVAEDNLDNQTVARRILERQGYGVALASDGVEALAALRQQRFDLVLMDMQMPNMDGLTATKLIRAGDGGIDPTVPVVAMTAHALVSDRERCLAAGMDDYLAKPISMQLLLEMVERMARQGRQDKRGS
ncbi:MAG TPA: response regulator [Geobacterales bacterium]|nr:response regulator [Geobacterales bacterium]